MCDHERDSLGAHLHAPYLAQLVLGLLRGNAVDGETTLGIIQQTEVFVGLLKVDNILENREENEIHALGHTEVKE